MSGRGAGIRLKAQDRFTPFISIWFDNSVKEACIWTLRGKSYSIFSSPGDIRITYCEQYTIISGPRLELSSCGGRGITYYVGSAQSDNRREIQIQGYKLQKYKYRHSNKVFHSEGT